MSGYHLDPDVIVERGQSDWQRRQDAQARKAGRYVEFKPRDVAIKPTGPTCPRCAGGAFLSGNMSFCRARACKWQGLSGYDPAIAHSELDRVAAA